MSEESPNRPSMELLPIGRPPMIGRLVERGAIVDAVTRSIEGSRCEVVTVIGNPGVGKSRLVSEVIADLAERQPTLRVFRGAARANSGIQPAIARILRTRFGLHEGSDAHAQANEVCAQVMDLFGDRRVDEILHFLGAFLGLRFGTTVLGEAFEEDPRAFQSVARAVLRRLFEVDAQRAPVMLVFEDMHLAGSDGIRVFRDLVTSIRRAPITVLCTARPELLAKAHDFFDAPQDRHLRVDLGPLSTGESQVLARMLLSTIEDVPAELVETAVSMGGGNPLLIEQIVRIFFDQGVIALEADGEVAIDLDKLTRISLPMSVDDAVRARLASLSPVERELMERAALMGPVFWLGGLVVLGRTGRTAPTIWGGAEDLSLQFRDLLKGLADRDYVLPMPDSSIPGDEEYAFKHNLEREQLSSLVADEEAVQHHLLLAEWLEFRIAERGEEQLDLLARHYELGNRPLRAARCFLQSADRARARYAMQKAVKHYIRGLELLGEHDVALRLDAHHHIGEGCAMLGRNAEAHENFRAMLALAWRLDLKGKGGAAHNRIGRLYRDEGRLDEAMRHLGTGLALFQSAGDEAGIAASLDDIGKIHWMRGTYDTALRFLQDGLTRREAMGDKRSIALSLNNIGLVYQDSGQYRGAYDALTRARDLRHEVGDLPGLTVTLNNLGTIHSDRGEDREAIAIWMQALDIAREIGDRRRQAVLLLNIGEGQYRLRNSDEALRILTEVEQLCVELNDRILIAEARRGLGKAHFLQGSITRALASLQSALEIFEQVRSKVHVAIAKRSLAEVLSAHGTESVEGRRAEVLFREALQSFKDLGAELELARTARTFADHLTMVPDGTAMESAFAEAESLRALADEIYARLRSDSEPAATDLRSKLQTDPGINRAALRSDLGARTALRANSVIPSALDRTPATGTSLPEGVRE
jgi:tetratricopeptide (TPR) repeat protein